MQTGKRVCGECGEKGSYFIQVDLRRDYLPSQIYEHGGFIIFPCGDSFIVYNTAKPFSQGHSHLRGFKLCKDAIFFVSKGKIPKRTNFYYLRTLQRLAVDERYIDEIEGLIEARKGKGKKQKYVNVPVYVR